MRYKKLTALLLAVAAAAMLTGCEPEPIDQERGAATTTSHVGGFIIEEYAPGFDDDWSSVVN